MRQRLARPIPLVVPWNSSLFELAVENNRIVIQAVRRVRQGWDEAIAAMAERGDDALLDAGLSGFEWDDDEW